MLASGSRRRPGEEGAYVSSFTKIKLIAFCLLLPGAGHLAAGKRFKGCVFLVCISLVFLAGVLIKGYPEPLWEWWRQGYQSGGEGALGVVVRSGAPGVLDTWRILMSEGRVGAALGFLLSSLPQLMFQLFMLAYPLLTGVVLFLAGQLFDLTRLSPGVDTANMHKLASCFLYITPLLNILAFMSVFDLFRGKGEE